MKSLKYILALGVFMMIPTALSANCGMDHGERKMPAFSDFDTNGDGKIVEQEFNDGHAKMMKKSGEKHEKKHKKAGHGFSRVDADGDGGISEKEFDDHHAAMQKKHKKHKKHEKHEKHEHEHEHKDKH